VADHHNMPTQQAARKPHKCIYCFARVEIGERYMQQTGFYEGARYRNRFHHECWDTLAEDHVFEFMPGEGEPPDRLNPPRAEGNRG
jgi:hypothetical protein